MPSHVAVYTELLAVLGHGVFVVLYCQHAVCLDVQLRYLHRHRLDYYLKYRCELSNVVCRVGPQRTGRKEFLSTTTKKKEILGSDMIIFYFY